tara:strand:- start:4524 stop:5456 length:933 start_codon:yes stop_codon:yes gene_type:complete
MWASYGKYIQLVQIQYRGIDIDVGIKPSKNTVQNLSQLMKTPTERSTSLELYIETPHNVWSECHKVQKYDGKYNYKNLKQLTKAEFMNMFTCHFMNELEKFKCVDQEIEGPCSLASLSHLFSLYGKNPRFLSVLKCTKPDKSFTVWYEKLGFSLEGYSTWLAFLNSAYVFTLDLLDHLHFIPFRFRRAYNKKLCKEPPQNANEYNEQINIFLKSLLDSKIAFAVPFEGHFVVVVGYSDTGYLIMNSFGNATGFDGLWFIGPEIDGTYTQLNFCNALTGILILHESDQTDYYTNPEPKKITRKPKVQPEGS